MRLYAVDDCLLSDTVWNFQPFWHQYSPSTCTHRRNYVWRYFKHHQGGTGLYAYQGICKHLSSMRLSYVISLRLFVVFRAGLRLNWAWCCCLEKAYFLLGMGVHPPYPQDQDRGRKPRPFSLAYVHIFVKFNSLRIAREALIMPVKWYVHRNFQQNKKAVLSQRWPRNAPYRCPENFWDSLTTPTALCPTFSWAFVPINRMNMFLQNLKSVALHVPEIIGVSKNFGQSLDTPTLPFLQNF